MRMEDNLFLSHSKTFIKILLYEVFSSHYDYSNRKKHWINRSTEPSSGQKELIVKDEFETIMFWK